MVAGTLLAALPAQAAEVVPRPGSGVFQVEGRGYGHGRGMSQWGAYGAADAGLDWTQILDFYYPGTARAAQANSAIRVQISVDSGSDVRVDPAAGLADRQRCAACDAADRHAVPGLAARPVAAPPSPCSGWKAPRGSPTPHP